MSPQPHEAPRMPHDLQAVIDNKCVVSPDIMATLQVVTGTRLTHVSRIIRHVVTGTCLTQGTFTIRVTVTGTCLTAHSRTILVTV